MAIRILGIDIVKRVFQLHGVDERGKVILKKKGRSRPPFKYYWEYASLFDW